MTPDTAALRALLDSLIEGLEPGPFHAVESGDRAAYSWWLENAAGDSTFPTPDDVDLMINALPGLLDRIERHASCPLDHIERLEAALERARNDLLAYGMHLNGELVMRGADRQHRLPGEPCKCGLDEAIARASAALGQRPQSHRERVALELMEELHA